MHIKSILKKSSFLFIVLAGTLIGVFAYAAAGNIPSRESLTGSNPNFPKNKSGETYGSARDVSPNEKDPDLIKARGINGKIGYVRATDLEEDEPKTPEEALAQQTKQTTRVINVYESDGNTIIDKFEIRPGNINPREKSEK